MAKKTDLGGSCASCDVVNCVNLFRHTDTDSQSVGGELYVYRQMSHDRVAKDGLQRYVCSNGRLLQCACFIAGSAYVERPDDYLNIISTEIVRDMKASFYLAMSGHYRQAILIQRSVFENFLYGLYFHTEYYFFLRNDLDREEVNKFFRNWMDGGFRKSDDYLLDVIERGRIISKAERKDWRVMFGQLSQFVHTILHTPTGQNIKYGNVEVSGCEAVVVFNRDRLIEWSTYFQRLLFLILFKLAILYPFIKQKEAGRLALKYLRAEFRDIAKTGHNPYLDGLLRMRSGKISAP